VKHSALDSGVVLTVRDAALIKGMLARGDRQHDIAAWFGVNAGRVAEVAKGYRFSEVEAAPLAWLPPSGPYPALRQTVLAIQALESAKAALSAAEAMIRSSP
jgi:hypothetical protein